MNRSLKSLASYVSSLAILAPTLARAECFEKDKAPEKADCVVMERGAQRGVWFSLEAAIKLQQSHLKVPELEALVAQLEEVNTLKGEELEYTKGALQEHLNVQAALHIQTDDALKRARRAEEDRDAWYRSPWLWLGIGVGATVGLAITAKVVLE
jgi:ElaB/YqjD/DUF883 family membrane-anchored ribosome-binding protein